MLLCIRPVKYHPCSSTSMLLPSSRLGLQVLGVFHQELHNLLPAMALVHLQKALSAFSALTDRSKAFWDN